MEPHVEGSYNDDEESDGEELTPELTAELGLSADTLAALQEHLAGKARSQEWVDTEGEVGADFSLAQFWYTEETSCGLLREALAHIEGQPEGEGVVAVLSAPSVMRAAVNFEGGAHQGKLRLLEVDERFGVKYPDQFHRYDYTEPTDLPPELLGRCDVLILDPPRLNVATLKEYFVSARLLAKPDAAATSGEAPPCIVVTGAWVNYLIAFGSC